jgi:hypothetical protein
MDFIQGLTASAIRAKGVLFSKCEVAALHHPWSLFFIYYVIHPQSSCHSARLDIAICIIDAAILSPTAHPKA